MRINFKEITFPISKNIKISVKTIEKIMEI